MEDKCDVIESRNGQLERDLEAVNKQNLALKRNISSLYKTAQTELARKDRQMKELQAQSVSSFIIHLVP